MLLHKLVYDLPSWWEYDHPEAEKTRESAIRACARVVSHLNTRGTFKMVDTLPMRTLVALELWRQDVETRTTNNRKRMTGIHGSLRERQWTP